MVDDLEVLGTSLVPPSDTLWIWGFPWGEDRRACKIDVNVETSGGELEGCRVENRGAWEG